MQITIALAGNPNCGKTTLFNHLTGSAQTVGNWPGVTVEKKEGCLKGRPEVLLQDLPGIYSLSPSTLEEVVAREYLVQQQPKVIINLLDGTNLERNLYLTTQLLELGLPVVVAVNMLDVLEKSGDTIDLAALQQELGCPVFMVSALKGRGTQQMMEAAVLLAQQKKAPQPLPCFSAQIAAAFQQIEAMLAHRTDSHSRHWYAVKLFERDAKVLQALALSPEHAAQVEALVSICETALDDDAESIITNERYAYIQSLVARCATKKLALGSLTPSDKIDRVVTNRVLALPIFALVMFVVYWLSITTVGTVLADFTNDTLFGAWIIPSAASLLEQLSVAPWLTSLIVDGIIGGVGAVLGFVPQMLLLFLLLSLLEDCGYMARVAFIMDRIFRRFGLSGKSFIPMLIGSGCSVPGIMASRTIEQERDRRMTIMTTSFIPCGAKMPIVALIAGALFGGAWWVAPLAYFIGVAAVIVSGVILKKTRAFAGKPAPFVMELPAYHAPTASNILRSTWERGWSFIKRAGTVILLASVVIWFLSGFGLTADGFGMVEDMDHSILAAIGGWIAPLFAPLGFGTWQSAVATTMGLVAKEEVVGVFGVLYGVSGDALAMVEEGAFGGLSAIAAHFTALSAFSFLLFNLLCAPCFAAIGAIKREMNSAKWTTFAVAYLCGFAYSISLLVYQLGLWLGGGAFTFGTAAALLIGSVLLYLLLRKPSEQRHLQPNGHKPVTAQ